MPGLALQLTSHLKGILSSLLLLLMGSTSFLVHMTGPFESGMLRLELQLVSPLRGILAECSLFLLSSGPPDSTARIWDVETGLQIINL
jgi:hypothetical protein